MKNINKLLDEKNQRYKIIIMLIEDFYNQIKKDYNNDFDQVYSDEFKPIKYTGYEIEKRLKTQRLNIEILDHACKKGILIKEENKYFLSKNTLVKFRLGIKDGILMTSNENDTKAKISTKSEEKIKETAILLHEAMKLNDEKKELEIGNKLLKLND